MSLLMPLGLSEITICGAHGVETILVDQDMNRVNPETAGNEATGHCGVCTLIFGLAWAIALTAGLAWLTRYLAPRRNDRPRAQRAAFELAFSRAPPCFS